MKNLLIALMLFTSFCSLAQTKVPYVDYKGHIYYQNKQIGNLTKRAALIIMERLLRKLMVMERLSIQMENSLANWLKVVHLCIILMIKPKSIQSASLLIMACVK